MLYQECIQGLSKNFGDRLPVVGDQNQVKSGYKYEIWGASADASTWYEQNITLVNAPKRQLRRVMKSVADLGDGQHGLRAFVLSSEEKKVEGDNIFDEIADEDCDSDTGEDDKQGYINHRISIIVVEGVKEEILRLRSQVNEYS